MKIFDNQEMKNYSNMRVGGKAKRLIILESKEEIIDVYKNEENTNIFILGNGTNVLFTDDFMDKTFVCTKKLNKIEDLGSNLVRVETGANLKDLTDFMRDKNYSGIESLFGIPGSIGGLVYMNGGAFGTEIFDKIVSIEVFDENHQIKEIKKEVEALYRGNLDEMDAFSKSVVTPVLSDLVTYSTDLAMKKVTQKGAWEDSEKIYTLLAVERNEVTTAADKVFKKFVEDASKNLGNAAK